MDDQWRKERQNLTYFKGAEYMIFYETEAGLKLNHFHIKILVVSIEKWFNVEVKLQIIKMNIQNMYMLSVNTRYGP